MKQWIPLVAAAVTVLNACSKESLQDDSIVSTTTDQTVSSSSQNEVYVSNWEDGGTWTKTDAADNSKFTLSRPMQQAGRDVVNGGLVLTFAKFADAEGTYGVFADPTEMPFYYLPPAERPNPYVNYFSDSTTVGNVSVAYTTSYTADNMPAIGGGATLKDVKFQYVVLPKKFLDSRGLTAQTVKSTYSYNQVMQLVSQ